MIRKLAFNDIIIRVASQSSKASFGYIVENQIDRATTSAKSSRVMILICSWRSDGRVLHVSGRDRPVGHRPTASVRIDMDGAMESMYFRGRETCFIEGLSV